VTANGGGLPPAHASTILDIIEAIIATGSRVGEIILIPKIKFNYSARGSSDSNRNNTNFKMEQSSLPYKKKKKKKK
jgi:hypothetical protein